MKEYSTGKALWASKPKTMLIKVAESQALRRAFSISGIYSPEEMGQWECEVQGIKFETKAISNNSGHTVSVSNGEIKYPSNYEYWKSYDWDNVDLTKQPKPQSWKANPKDPSKKIPDKQAIEIIKMYFFACDLMPKDKVNLFYEDITGKKYGYNYADIQKIVGILVKMYEDLDALDAPGQEVVVIDEDKLEEALQ
jgi:hypothetical protein